MHVSHVLKEKIYQELGLDTGLGNYVSFLKFGKINHRIIPQKR